MLVKAEDIPAAVRQVPLACVHQVIRPRPPWARLEGWGDCLSCSADAANAACAGYRPFPAPQGKAPTAKSPTRQSRYGDGASAKSAKERGVLV